MSSKDENELKTFRTREITTKSSLPLVGDPSTTGADPRRFEPTSPDFQLPAEPNVRKSAGRWNLRDFLNKSRGSMRESGRLSALIHFSLMHIPAVAITLTLLALHIANVRWANPSIESLNALQFAAKAHEALVLMSLGDMLLHRISYGLSQPETGLPLGFLPSAFYLGAPLRYMVSHQLWSPIFHHGFKRRFYGTTGVMILLISILCVAASPLSAIAIIPRQRWWKDNGYVSEEGQGQSAKVPHVVYRTALDAKSGPSLNETGLMAVPDYIIIQSFAQIMPALVPKASESADMIVYNSSYSLYYAPYRPISVASLDGMTIATAPMSSVAISLSLESSADMRTTSRSSPPRLTAAEKQVGESDKGIAWKQPLLAVSCATSTLKEGVAVFNFTSTILNDTITLSSKNSTSLAEFLKSVSPVEGTVDHHFVNLRDNMRMPTSADILFARVVYRRGRPITVFDLCLISARWVEADIWVDRSKSPNVVSHLPFPKMEVPERIKSAFGSSDFINMKDEWMDGIFSTSNVSFYDAIPRFCSTSGADSCIQYLLGLHISDALSKEADPLINPEAPDFPMDTLLFTWYSFTHAYGFQSSWGLILAMSLLLLHVLMVLVYLTVILRSKHPWQGSDWATFGDVLVLALRSKAPDDPDELGEQEEEFKSKIWIKTIAVGSGANGGPSQILLTEEKGYQRTSQDEEDI